MENKYPIYIISKGRWESRLTSKALEGMKSPYRIVIEPQEYNQYSSVIDKNKILVLPFSNLGQGSIPARNWVWEHSISEGHKRHWILDDNIYRFWILNENSRTIVKSATIFRMAEDFIDRYVNIALAGFQYDFFSPAKQKQKPFSLNTRIYSCINILNSLDHRWRGRYNEDTDLSLRCLKDGWCTVLFYMFQMKKVQTMVMKGGNTDNVYTDNDERFKFAESLMKQHPDCVKIVRKFKRWHHQVDYRQFKNNLLIRRKDIEIENKPNDYGMKIVYINDKNGDTCQADQSRQS